MKQKVHEAKFFLCKSIYIMKFYSMHYTLRWNTNINKNFLWTKWTLQKMHSFFFCELQLIIVLLLIHDSYTSWNTRFISLKNCVGLPIFNSFSFLSKFYFCSTKSMNSLNLKRHNSFQNKNNRNSHT